MDAWIQRFPRLRDLYNRSRKSESDNCLAKYFEVARSHEVALKHLEWVEGNLALIEVPQWEKLAEKVLPDVCNQQESRGWEQFWNYLNESLGYILLAKRGYSNIRFIDSGEEKAPDIEGEFQASWAFVEVKTINRSEADVSRPKPGPPPVVDIRNEVPVQEDH